MRFRGAAGSVGRRQRHLLAERACMCVCVTHTHPAQTGDCEGQRHSALLTPDVDAAHDTQDNEATKAAASPPNLSSNQPPGVVPFWLGHHFIGSRPRETLPAAQRGTTLTTPQVPVTFQVFTSFTSSAANEE